MTYRNAHLFKRLAPVLLLPVALFALLLSFSELAHSAERKVTKNVLDNGLTVIVEEDHTAPVVAFQMWVRVGSADEKAEEAGLSHVFEHMLFKGTERRAVGRIAAEVDEAGGGINAYTSYDQTVYLLVVASRYFDKGLDILSDAIQHSAFDPAELEKELEVVIEEIKRGEDSPDRQIYKKLMETAFTDHPYRKTVIGTYESVKSLERENLVKFFRKWYVPNNMTLVIAGDVETKAAIDAASVAFSDFSRGIDRRKTRPKEPAQLASRTAVISEPVVQARMALGFHIPELKHADNRSLDVLALILGEGAGSRLYKKIKHEEDLVHSISASAMTPRDPGLFIISSLLDADKAEKALARTIEEIRTLALEGPTEAELDKAKLSLESEFIYDRETMEGKARILGYSETLTGGLDFEEEYVAGVRKVTAEDVKAAASKYLTLENSTAVLLLPEKEKESVAAAQIDGWVKSAFEKERAANVAATKVVLENGITIILKEEHSNPTVSFYANFPGGTRFETPDVNGIASFTASMLTRGTKKRTRDELISLTEGMAASVSGFSARNSTGVSGKFLSKDFDVALDVVADLIMNPVFPEDELKKLKDDRVAAIKREEDELSGYTFKLLRKTLYKTHPYGMPITGEIETVSAFDVKKIFAFHKNIFVPERMVLSVVGDFNAAVAARKIKDAFKDFKRGESVLKKPEDETRQSEKREISETKDKAQTHIAIAFLGSRLTDEDNLALDLLSQILAGQGGRLFIELRDKQSLAYSVDAYSVPGVDPGIFGVYIGTSPDKKDAAINGMLTELRKVLDEPVTEEELNRAKSAMIGGYEIGLQDPGAKAADMATNELLGLGFDHYTKYGERLSAITREDVLKAARKYVTLGAHTIAVVGPTSTDATAK